MSGDLIGRSEVLAALSSRLSIVDMVRVAEIVESVPAVEAESVVRCKDCIYDRRKCPVLGDGGYVPDDDFYCAEGERRINV